MTAPSASKARGRRRQPPSPNSVLDPAALRSALDEANVSVRPVHITAFYQALHRQGFPPLPQFVENYEAAAALAALGDDQEKTTKTVSNTANTTNSSPIIIALKNPVSARRQQITKVELPRSFLHFLKTTTRLQTLTSKVAVRHTSKDQTTTKLVVELQDGHVVESVLMRYVNDYSGGRASLCVSSQVGCAMGCTFCATGTMGLYGNLTTGEILEQIVHADKILAEEQHANNNNHGNSYEGQENADTQNKKQVKAKTANQRHGFVRNVVFMGMGEPLDNFNNVVAACRALIHPQRWNLAHHCVTVSTVGLISQIRKLTAELPQVSLALSLHAPNQAARQAIVPTASRYPIEELVEALDDHLKAYEIKRQERRGQRGNNVTNNNKPMKDSARRRAMIEYVMLEGPTSTLECAHELGRLCQGRSLVVNLIPYNATNVKDKLRCPSEDHLQEFRRIVASYDVFCTIRRTMGADIDSACGQLVQSVKEKKEQDGVGGVVVDIEDVVAAKPSKGKSMMTGKRTPTVKAETLAMNPETTSTATLDLEPWIRPLTIATVVSAVCFVVSAGHYLKPRR